MVPVKTAKKVKLQRGSPNMGEFTVEVGVSRPGGGQVVRVKAMVDTGATHSMFPASLMSQLNVRSSDRRPCSLADGQVVEYYYGIADIEIDGRTVACPAIFGAEDQYLLGATTLECFDLMVDPVAAELVARNLYTGPI